MIDFWRRNGPRLLELLAERSLFGLEAEDEFDLERILAGFEGADRDVMDRVAARCDLAMGIAEAGPLPTDLQERIRAEASGVLGRGRCRGEREKP